jgi:hypothetical protein
VGIVYRCRSGLPCDDLFPPVGRSPATPLHLQHTQTAGKAAAAAPLAPGAAPRPPAGLARTSSGGAPSPSGPSPTSAAAPPPPPPAQLPPLPPLSAEEGGWRAKLGAFLGCAPRVPRFTVEAPALELKLLWSEVGGWAVGGRLVGWWTVAK